MAMKVRKKKLTAAQIGNLYQLLYASQRVHLMRMNLEGETFKIEATVPQEEHIPMDYIKREMARKLVDAVIEADLVKIDVADKVYGYLDGKILRGSLTVMVPRR